MIAATFAVYDFRERLPTVVEACEYIPMLHVPARYRDSDIFFASCPWEVSIDTPKMYLGKMLLGEHGAIFYPSPQADRLPNDPSWWLAVKPSRLKADAQSSRSADAPISTAQRDPAKVWFTIRMRAWQAERTGDFSVSGARYSSVLLVDRFLEIRDAK